jgi:hypothetical protein
LLPLITLVPNKALAEEQAPPAGEHARGEGHEGGEAHEGHGGHHPHHEISFGASLVGLGARHGGEWEGHFGVGGFLEFTPIPRWLEIEIGLRVLSGKEGVELPLDLTLKKPFHLNEWIHPFVGLGPTVLFTPAEDASPAHIGLNTMVGSDFWLSHHVGVSFELNYNLISNEGAVHEAGGGAGVIFGY